MQQAISNVYRRVQQMIRVGTLTQANETGNAAVYQIQHNEFETPDGSTVIQQYGFVSSPPLGAKVVTASLAGDASAKIVVGTHDPKSRMKNLKAGEVAIHDSGGNHLYFKDGKLLEITVQDTVTINAPNGANINGNLKVKGSITATEDVTAGTISLKTHKTTGVQTGSGISGSPV